MKEKLHHYLEIILYCEKLRELINELKDKDDFRPEGLRTFINRKVKHSLIFVPFVLLALLLGRVDGIIFTLILMLQPYLHRGREIPLISIGCIGYGKLIGIYDYFYNYRLDYSRVDPNGRERKIVIRGFTKVTATKIEDKEAQLYPEKRIITVLQHPQNAYFCMPYAPSVHLEICISNSRYEKLKTLPFIREKING